MLIPIDPLQAVTSIDPYSSYAELITKRPFYYDDRLKLWVASSAEAVKSVITNPACRVRPVSEPIPVALAGSVAGDIFGQLVRMTEGATHCAFKPVVTASLTSIDRRQLKELSQHWAAMLYAPGTSDLTNFAFRLPVYVVASLLDMPATHLDAVVSWTDAFSRCIAPGSTPAQLEQGRQAAEHLYELFRSFQSRLLANLSHPAHQTTTDPALANAIGLLFQTYEATAGLIGNTLQALAARPEVYAAVKAEPKLLAQAVEEVSRYDPPIQNTRRFVEEDTSILGHRLPTGSVVLVLLAAANRDPASNPDPAHFDLYRAARQIFTFGFGNHACPGYDWATLIATVGITHLLEAGLDPSRLIIKQYRPSLNARVPLLSIK